MNGELDAFSFPTPGRKCHQDNCSFIELYVYIKQENLWYREVKNFFVCVLKKYSSRTAMNLRRRIDLSFFFLSKGYFLFLFFLDGFCPHILDIADWTTEAHTVSALHFPESLEEYHTFKTIWFINFITQNLIATLNCFSLKIKC